MSRQNIESDLMAKRNFERSVNQLTNLKSPHPTMASAAFHSKVEVLLLFIHPWFCDFLCLIYALMYSTWCNF